MAVDFSFIPKQYSQMFASNLNIVMTMLILVLIFVTNILMGIFYKDNIIAGLGLGAIGGTLGNYLGGLIVN
jgi:hypothetical protein